MSKSLVIAMACTAFAVAAPLSAQSTAFGIGAYAGVSLPLSDYAADNTDDSGSAGIGITAGLDLYYPLAMAGQLNWLTSVGVNAHGADEEGFTLGDGGDAGGYLMFPIVTGLRYDIPLGLRSVFVTGQAGVSIARAPSIAFGAESADSDWATPFTWTVGGGFQATENVHFGARYVSLGDVEWTYEGTLVNGTFNPSVSFVDIYLGFGVH